MKIKKLLILFLFAQITAVLFLFSTPNALAINDTMPRLQITIPNLNLSPLASVCTGEGANRTCSTAWIAQYITAIYKYALGIVGILATVVLMVGGIIWLTAGGSASRITEAKAWIGASLTGLIIALASYTILYQVNPNLVTFGFTTFGVVQEIEGDSNTSISDQVITSSASLENINCDGTSDLSTVINSMSGKITYQMGGKGAAGPNNTLYLDCSGFINYALKCSNLSSKRPQVNGGTANIFSNQTKLNYNGGILLAGTLVGWPPGGGKPYGHVWISLGDGTFAESHGGKSGKQPGGAIRTGVTIDQIQNTANKYGRDLYVRYL